jgi:actin-related protein 3
MNHDKLAVVIDNGTGYTKMGYASNCEPQYIVPTTIATNPANEGAGVRSKEGIDDLDFYIGNEVRGLVLALSAALCRGAPPPFLGASLFLTGLSVVQALQHKSYQVNYPIRHGLIENWDNMEKLWQRCLFKYMRCEPEEHFVLLTEPPLNTPVTAGRMLLSHPSAS